MRTIPTWALPLLLASALAAQQRPPQPTPKSPAAAERYAALKAEQKKLNDEWMTKAKAVMAEVEAAKKAGKPTPAMPMRPDTSALGKQALAAAKEATDGDDAVPFLVMAIGADRAGASDALSLLGDKYADHPGTAQIGSLIGFLPRLVGDDKAPAIAEKFAKSKNADVRGWAMFAKHEKTVETAGRDTDAYQGAKSELIKAAELASSADLKDRIREAIDTREKFGAGNVAPDIEGADLDGVAFKLSDYRGKVVFLDFWGDW
ncbi:MAG: hypothetical protein FJ306_05825 [Planctomycetes bacterium]|nr:hypothetical protein [Planctomycetota bacterium]